MKEIEKGEEEKGENAHRPVARDKEGKLFSPETAGIKRGGEKLELAVEASYKTNTTHVETHVGNHSEATDFMCDGCGEKCNMEDNIGRHGKRMQKEGNNFTWKHIKHSHEEEMFSCPVCKCSFTERNHFKIHVANHSEATNFMCDDCGEKCNTEDNIGRHGKRMHKEGTSLA